MSDPQLILYSYWRSSAAWRIRIILALKAIAYRYEARDLQTSGQHSAEYAALNPMQQVPTLVVDGSPITNSIAIAEYLEEAPWAVSHGPSLLPTDPMSRAQVRAIVSAIACDIHPLHNLRVVQKLAADHGVDRSAWTRHWVASGFAGVEAILRKTAGKHAVGDQITLADVFLVPQAVGGVRYYGLDVSPFPTIQRVVQAASQLPAFLAAEPENQPDAVAK